MGSISKRLENLVDNEKTGHFAFSGYSLSHIKKLLKYYGNPHKKIKTVHVAGTNGKGSTCHMLHEILTEAGYCTGIYTSPHLLRINERIKAGGAEITNKKLDTYTEELIDLLNKKKEIRPTYFDALTLFAFRFFLEMKTDIAVIEVGLGGRLDSTNLVRPEVSVITDISIDHKNVLGSTIKEIAIEKAGIIKPHTPVVTSNTKSEILGVLKKTAKENSAEICVPGADYRITNKILNDRGQTAAFDFSARGRSLGEAIIIKNISIKQPGDFQIKNASCAIAASLLLRRKGFDITESHIRNGLKKFTVPGRLQILSARPLIVFDPAHNSKALESTISALKKLYAGMSFKIVVSFMKDKEYGMMFKIIRNKLTDDIYYYELDDERCMKAGGNNRLKNVKIFNSVDSLYSSLAGVLDDKSCIFVTGSFRLYKIAAMLAVKIKKDIKTA